MRELPNSRTGASRAFTGTPNFASSALSNSHAEESLQDGDHRSGVGLSPRLAVLRRTTVATSWAAVAGTSRG